MSEPAKKPVGPLADQQPEGYQPRKPEIVSMAAQAQGQTQAQGASQAATASGGSGGSRRIPNVPVFYYDGTNAGFFNTLLAAALQSLGEECDRAKLTALSGEGNRFCWMDGVWHGGCESSEAINETPYETESRILGAIGWKAEYVIIERDSSGGYMNTGPAQIRRDFVGSIDQGYPVIARLARHPESNINLFFGYEDDGKKIISYDYIKDFEPGVSKHEEYETVAENNWEDNIAGYILLQGKEETASERNTALSAFRWISGHARRTAEINGKLVGFAAWESYLRMIEHDNFAKLSPKDVWARWGIYCDAMGQINERKAALPYYRSLSEQFPAWREELDAAVAALDACVDHLGSMWAEEFNHANKKAIIKKFRDPAARKGFAAAGRECMRKDMEAVGCFEAILRKEGLI